jgi:HAD superfamily phosphatase (TIGR01668 family)
MFHIFVPHLRVKSVSQLSLSRLRSLELEALLLDVDCTLKRYSGEEAAPEVEAWLEELRQGGIGLCLVSNGMGGRVRRFAEKLELPFVSKALKPFPMGCRAAVRKMRFQPSRTAMVGDQLFADVMAARLAGLKSILVEPIHPEDEPWFTRLKRVPERYFLRRMKAGQEPQADGQGLAQRQPSPSGTRDMPAG